MNLSVLLDRVRRFGLEVLGFYYSKYQAYVVDNEDPRNQNRLFIVVPSILGESAIPMWAHQSGSYHGIHIIPEIGDMVWVEFQNGKLEAPIWSYHFPINNNKPEEFENNKCYGFKSPGGYLVLINEENKTLLVKTPQDLSLEITEDSVICTSDKILLTKEDVEEKVPLGNTMDGDIKDTLNHIKALVEKLQLFSTAQADVSVGPLSGFAVGFTDLNTATIQALTDLAQDINKFSDESHLSEKVKLS